MELIRFDVFNPIIQFSDKTKRNTENRKRVFGCDEMIQYMILYKHNGKYFTGGITVNRYSNNWYIQNLSCDLANINSGMLKKVSGIVEYEYLLKQQ